MGGDGWDGNERRDRHWHLDKRVNLATIITIAAAILGVYVANAVSLGKMEERILTLESWVAKNDSIGERLGRIEEGQSWIRKAIERIDTRLP